MATYTAQILIGQEHQNHGGLLPSPLWHMFLAENSTPQWRLHDASRGTLIATWVPEMPTTILEDGLLAVAYYVVREEWVVAMINRHIPQDKLPSISLAETLSPDTLREMRRVCRKSSFESDHRTKLVIVACDRSSVVRQLPIVAKYGFDCEIIAPKFYRGYSAWRKEVVEKGSLDDVKSLTNARRSDSMDVPQDTTLPFFTYGLFKPGQLGFHRIKDYVQHQIPCSVTGKLYERDGLPLLELKKGGSVTGCLLRFNHADHLTAYQRIVEIEPDKQYRWEHVPVECNGDTLTANVLVGRQLRRGSVPFEEREWDGRKDALFTVALELIDDMLETHSGFEWDLKPLFHLQMAYLLLWTSIERYVSLRYHLGDKVMEKVQHLSREPAFAAALEEVVSEPRNVIRADRPKEGLRFNPKNPKTSLEYYYQVRSNITHRGKAVVRDHEIVEASLRELLAIFRRVLTAAFEDSPIE